MVLSSLALFVLPLCSAPLPVVVDSSVPGVLRTVDARGRGDFTDLQSAIDAAAPGDVILIRSDLVLASTVVVNKGLTITSDREAALLTRDVKWNAALLRIESIPSNETVALRNVSFSFVQSFDGSLEQAMVEVRDAAGTVWIEDVHIEYTTTQNSFFPEQWSGLTLERCASVVLIRVRAEPRSTFMGNPVFPNETGLRVTESSVHAWECTFVGPGGGTLPGPFDGIGGGHGAELIDAFLFAEDCSFEGGFGSTWCEGGCGEPTQAGGDGLRLDTTSQAVSVGCTFLGGQAGDVLGSFCPCLPGPDGEPVMPPGNLEELPVEPRSLELSWPVRVGRGATLLARGRPGDLVFSLVSSAPYSVYVQAQAGSQVVALPVTVIQEGVVSPTGTLVRTLPPNPHLPAGCWVPRYRQGLFLAADGAAYLGSASLELALPSSFALGTVAASPARSAASSQASSASTKPASSRRANNWTGND